MLFAFLFSWIFLLHTANSYLAQDSSIYSLATTFLQGNADFLLQLEPHIDDPNAIDALYEVVDLINYNDTDDNNTTPLCAGCRAAVTALKGLAAANEWEELREIVMDLCFYLFDNVTDDFVRSDILCPGSIDLQGPHIYEVLLPKYRKSPEDTCRNLNLCFPPKEIITLDDQVKKHVEQKRNDNKKTLSQRKLEAVKIVQLTDIHIEPDYLEGTTTDCGLVVCCVPDYGEGDAGLYGDYRCNIPVRTMELFLEKAAEFQPQFVIYSGDTPPHAIWEETYDSQLQCNEILTQSMTRILGDYSVYPNLGNHEMYPTNLYSMEYLLNYTGSMNAEFVDMWGQLAGFTEENIDTMLAGGYYSIQVAPGLRIISINTNYWYSFNWYNVLHDGGEEIPAMMEFIRTSFAEARENGDNVILVGHHPPGTFDSLISYTRELEQVLAEYADILVMQIAGHTHNDEFRVLSVEGTAVAVTWAAPSVTGRSKDPSMRVFYMDSDTAEVIDYEKYGFSLLDTIGSVEAPNITLQYSAMVDYELEDMSPNSWRQLIDRMETDDALFTRYYANFVARATNETCDDSCRTSHICSSKYYSFDDYYYCVEGGPQPQVHADYN